MPVGYLSEVARRRIAALLLVVGIAVAVLAITDTGPLFDDPPTEEERVQDTVEDFYGAAIDGDFVAYCGLLTRGARELVQRNAARLIEEAGRLKCQDIVSVAADSFKGLRLRIREVALDALDLNARVEVDLKRPGEGNVESRTVLLEKLDSGDWRVSDPG